MEYNIYCDESCHLENDQSKVMVLGAIWCPKEKRKEIFGRIREIKTQFGLPANFEIKWNKVSPAKADFYLQLINYFFDDDDLHFRALVVPDKTALNHNFFNQNHDTFYYKMYFDMLKVILSPVNSYNIYIDIKDTRSQEKVEQLCQVLRNSHYDYNSRIIKRVQQIQSHEAETLQLADLLIGATGYLHRGLQTNEAKLRIIEKMQKRAGYSFKNSTLYREDKTNIFIWKPRNA